MCRQHDLNPPWHRGITLLSHPPYTHQRAHTLISQHLKLHHTPCSKAHTRACRRGSMPLVTPICKALYSKAHTNPQHLHTILKPQL